jgi:hypothetical protein
MNVDVASSPLRSAARVRCVAAWLQVRARLRGARGAQHSSRGVGAARNQRRSNTLRPYSN